MELLNRACVTCVLSAVTVVVRCAVYKTSEQANSDRHALLYNIPLNEDVRGGSRKRLS
jgi:hypothetical protein